MRVLSILSALVVVNLLSTQPLLTDEIPADIRSCGDVNGDEVVNISDTIYLLNFLFLSGPPPTCAASGAEPVGTPCSRSAELAAGACQEGALAEFRLARARCANLASPYEVEECVSAARDVLEDALEECEGQLEARLGLCETLGEDAYQPSINPADFVAEIDNPYFPLVPGTTYVYEKETGEGTERTIFKVTDKKREILGVECTVIFEAETEDNDDEEEEETVDWFAQDTRGNVWHFGGRTVEKAGGEITGVSGAWEAGVDGARPGIVMPATPTPADVYRQEYLLAEAENAARVLSLAETAVVPVGSFQDCLQTEEFTPLEPELREHKFYTPGVGLVLEIDLETGERVELIDVRRED